MKWKPNRVIFHQISDWNDAYANAPNIPGGERWPAARVQPAQAYRDALQGSGRATLDISYGEGARNRFDLFGPEGRPKGLVVFVHGGFWKALDKNFWSHLARGSVESGYAVVMPQRPGHGETGGPYLEDQRGCDGADYYVAGLATASSIRAAIEYMTLQPFVRRAGVVVVGQSAGAWGVLALASQNPPIRLLVLLIELDGERVEGRLPGGHCGQLRALQIGLTMGVPGLFGNQIVV